tara:strand:- start:66 stop:416 length:351 start_codon:yes stop_codon:yes gene_type:complete
MMGVWEPKDKPTVFSQIKKLIGARTGPLRVFRVCLYPGILIILVFLLFTLLTGCASMQWPWKKDNDAIIVTDLPPREFICTKIDCGDEDIDELVADEQNTIACIKLQPECNVDLEN